MNPKTEALLYAASRTQHFYEVIQPALNEGKIVLCDRFLDSSIAYQGYGRNLGQNAIEEINDFGLNHQRPDLTLFFKVPLSVSQKRMEKEAISIVLMLKAWDFIKEFVKVLMFFLQLIQKRRSLLMLKRVQKKLLIRHIRPSSTSFQNES